MTPDRILREGRSTSTEENRVFSQRLFAEQRVTAAAPIVVVTGDFHVSREVRIARKAGFGEVSGGGADAFVPSVQCVVAGVFCGDQWVGCSRVLSSLVAIFLTRFLEAKVTNSQHPSKMAENPLYIPCRLVRCNPTDTRNEHSDTSDCRR
ncbi:ElyC/SanA/YdcF family protein [Cupriavidus necator]|uniref:ElyC/SanA/YdcF family protein n=1 Tax=Cupriavidus necator TaxID=106590 RepID=UPI00339D6BE0